MTVESTSVVLTLRPQGRGNWHTTEALITGPHTDAPLFLRGSTISIGARVFRVVAVAQVQQPPRLRPAGRGEAGCSD